MGLAAILAFGATSSDAQTFIRGDTNSDREVTISDTQYTLNWLFRSGDDPDCWATGDVNDDGNIDLSDPIALLNHFYNGAAPPCAPFANEGEDPTSPELPCESYGEREKFDDPSARLEVEVGDVSDEGVLTLRVLLSSSVPVSAYAGVVRFDGDVIANAEAETRDLFGDPDATKFEIATVRGGILRFGYLASFVENVAIEPGESRPVLEIDVCLVEGTAPGEYAAAFEGAELTELDSSRAIDAATSAGTVVVPAGLPGGAGCPSPETTDAEACDPGSPPGPPPGPPPPPPGESVDFVRGDVDGDGVVGLADGARTLEFLFQGGSIPCQDAGDFNDDGALDLSDVIMILISDVAGGTPCPPFPDVGPDPTDDRLHCAVYGEGTPIDDPAAEIGLLDATADASGGASLTLSLTNTDSVAGYTATLIAEGDVIADVVEITDLSGSFASGFQYAAFNDDGLRVSFLASISEPRSIPGGSAEPVLTLDICLAGGTAAGDYAIELADAALVDDVTSRRIPARTDGGTLTVPADIADGCPRDADGAPDVGDCGPPPAPPPPPPVPPEGSVPFLRGDANEDGKISISDALLLRRFLFLGDLAPRCYDAGDVNDDGTVDLSDVIFIVANAFLDGPAIPPPYAEIGDDPTDDGLHCAAYDPVPPSETDDVIRVGDVTAAPGQLVEVPIFVSNTIEVEAFQLFVRMGPEVDLAESPENLAFTGSVYDRELDAPFHLVSEIEDGLLAIGFIPSLVSPNFELPPGDDWHVFSVPLRVAGDAEPGTVTLDLTNGDDGEGIGELKLRNELTHRGSARFASILPVLEDGVMQIIGEVIIFRGDANGDDDLNIADPLFVLNYLFADGGPPSCPDAADADDDGVLTIADAMSVLNTLFTPTATIAPPYPQEGLDPTPDELGPCLR